MVAARNTSDVVAAVNFARRNNLRLLVKGGGHSDLGTSNAPDSLLIWTRAMNAIAVYDAFMPRACEGKTEAVPAVSVGAGAIWMHTYDAVTTQAGRYVQGGGCGTVGVAGLVQGGGFGTHSKAFGIAGASLLEAEVVTADGVVRVANRCSELFWALKGGGGGTFGVVTRLTLRTWELPASFGSVSVRVQANSEEAFRRLVRAFVAFYAERLCNPHWGELAQVMPGNRLEIGMNFQGLTKAQAELVWQPPGFPGIRGHSPNTANARRDTARVALAMAQLRKVAPAGGAYVAESSYFQPDWQRAYWGANYPRLLAAKARYDPTGLFFARHGVGSERWSEDGFDRLA
jgi:FAD/FMN-containing dehydrogenase